MTRATKKLRDLAPYDNGTYTCTASIQDGNYVGSCSGDGELGF